MNILNINYFHDFLRLFEKSKLLDVQLLSTNLSTMNEIISDMK